MAEYDIEIIKSHLKNFDRNQLLQFLSILYAIRSNKPIPKSDEKTTDEIIDMMNCAQILPEVEQSGETEKVQ